MAEGPQAPQSVASFEASLEELEKVVKQLETGELALDRSLELFSRGMQLSESCRKQLEDAETRVEMLIRKEGAYQGRAVHREIMSLKEFLAGEARRIDEALDRLTPPESAAPETIHRAMRY